jgi:hypothetical protein
LLFFSHCSLPFAIAFFPLPSFSPLCHCNLQLINQLNVAVALLGHGLLQASLPLPLL